MTAVITKPRGENIIKLNSVSWGTFNRLLDELGNKRNQRLTYYDDTLEIMSPLGIHENNIAVAKLFRTLRDSSRSFRMTIRDLKMS